MGSIAIVGQMAAHVMIFGTNYFNSINTVMITPSIVEIEKDTIATTNGSARVRIGATEILVGVKAELEKPDLKSPDEGKRKFENSI